MTILKKVFAQSGKNWQLPFLAGYISFPTTSSVIRLEWGIFFGSRRVCLVHLISPSIGRTYDGRKRDPRHWNFGPVFPRDG